MTSFCQRIQSERKLMNSLFTKQIILVYFRIKSIKNCLKSVMSYEFFCQINTKGTTVSLQMKN